MSGKIEEKTNLGEGDNPKVEKKKDVDMEDLTEEDRLLKEEFDLCIERLQENNSSLYRNALELLRKRIRESTTSMTSLPKPLKFLRPHYDTLKTIYEKIDNLDDKKFCADVISVLAMTYTQTNECLKYRLLGSLEEVSSWGHEYVRHLLKQTIETWNLLEDEDVESFATTEQLTTVAKEVVEFNMKHNAETDACDLCMELDQLDILDDYIDTETYQRVCRYLLSCLPYEYEPADGKLLEKAYQFYVRFERWIEAVRCGIQLSGGGGVVAEDDVENEGMKHVIRILLECKDDLVRKQICFILGRHQFWLNDEILEQISTKAKNEKENDDDFDPSQLAEELKEILSQSHLNNNFMALATELDIKEAKKPDDIYKTYLETRTMDRESAMENLADTFVNGFVNAGFGTDALLLSDKSADWIGKHKDHGKVSATASLGLIVLWDIEAGLTDIDRYLYNEAQDVKTGALMAIGIVNCGVRNESDPAIALLSQHVSDTKEAKNRLGAVFGLGIAYAGTQRKDVVQLIMEGMENSPNDMDVMGIAAISMGLIAVGSCDGEITTTILQKLIEMNENDKLSMKLRSSPFSKYLIIGLGLLYMGSGENVNILFESFKAIPVNMQKFADVLVTACAYAATGNVLKIQQFLYICGEFIEKKETKPTPEEENKKNNSNEQLTSSAMTATGTPSGTTSSKKKKEEKKEIDQYAHLHEAMAAIGVSMIAIGEDIGNEMSFRMFGHLLHFGDQTLRKAVPLALGLSSISNPQLMYIDTLNKFSHDSDSEVACNAIFALGLVGAGTNNARLASILRQLAQFHAKDPNLLFMVRIAQGLTHMGKGTLCLQPFHSDKTLLHKVGLSALLTVLLTMYDANNTIFKHSHYLLFYLAAAMQPRLIQTFDENLDPLSVTVRVGQAVDIVGQAGKPKTITGFQTHTTPVVLGAGERAELATEEYIPLSPIIEGFVILKKNPDYISEKIQ
ncbi:hypothetical protein SNEBB_002698 [Seison nebaliae]|nr:hypothetical protein SNEBB_002698 [Seison nebaliae]